MFWHFCKKYPFFNSDSFFDPKNIEDPGPGAHDLKRIDRHTPSEWKFNKSKGNRDSFIEKHHLETPISADYNSNAEVLLPSAPGYSIPKSKSKNVYERRDERSRFDYSPKVAAVKSQMPKFSFGYVEERNYDNGVPGPSDYETVPKFNSKNSFNQYICVHAEHRLAFRPP